MRKAIHLGIGSMIGAMLRYAVNRVPIANLQEMFPFSTLFINVTGAFLLALILTIAFEIRAFDADIRLGITTGGIGSFTTFSTLCKETVLLFERGYRFSALAYVTVSLMLGLGAACFGIVLARKAGPVLLARRTMGPGSHPKERDENE